MAYLGLLLLLLAGAIGDGGSVHGLGLVTSCVSLASVLNCQLASSSKMTSLKMISCFESGLNNQ